MNEFGFKFEIGSFVVPKCPAVSNGDDGRSSRRQLAGACIVVERTLQQCPGGVQRHYAVRHVGLGSKGYGLSGEIEVGAVKDYFRYNEIELESFDDAVARHCSPPPPPAAKAP